MAPGRTISNRDTRRAAAQAVSAVNTNAAVLREIGLLVKTLKDGHEQHAIRLAGLPGPTSTLWQRVRWVLRGA